MPFEVPTSTFNVLEHATNKVLRSNQLEETILQQFKSAYEDFWGVSGSDQTKTVKGDPEATPPTEDTQVTTFVGAGSRYSVEEMQAILDALGATAIAIMAAAGGLVQFIDAAYPGVLADRYKAAGFDCEMTAGGLKLTKLAEVWAEPAKENL
jgi:hypothetical protein